ncbi:MAG TPA: Slp family lipoprotein, partial [Nitrospira sp.]
MRRVIAVAALLICMGLTACSHPQLFPSEAMEGVDPNFDFTRWRMMPNQAAEKKIQLGGRILQSQAKTDQVTIVVAQLPIVEHPAYGPKEVGRPSSEFAITYDGKIDSLFLQGGNRVIVVGTTRAAIVVPVDDLPRSLPSVAA